MADALGRQFEVEEGETMSAYFSRLGWATVQHGHVRPTKLGMAVLQELNRPTVDVSTDEPVTVVIDPTDPLAYARVFDVITGQSAGMIVDPYLGTPQFFDLADVPSVTRILTGDQDMSRKRPILAHGLAAVTRPLEVRYLPAKELHDRFFIPDLGDVVIFGSSLNTISRRPGVITPLPDKAASEAIRGAYQRLWERAVVIEPTSTAAVSSPETSNRRARPEKKKPPTAEIASEG
ncbi:hypothetical protein [Gryllotalpicola koreensis]|uniref:hypothetical protein n=1 Tax=Gryllotalpicola koreensis TaxID=993086 RepID=UPI0031D35672